MPPGKPRSLAHSILLRFLAEQLRRKFRSFRAAFAPEVLGATAVRLDGDEHATSFLVHSKKARVHLAHDRFVFRAED